MGYGIKIFVPRLLHYVTRSPGYSWWFIFVVLQKLNHEGEETKEQPWGERSSDESSTEDEDEVSTRRITYEMSIKNY